MRLSEQVRLRLREEMHVRELSQRDVANLLKWTQGRVAKLLKGRNRMDLDDLEDFCIVLDLRPTEVVRDRGYEFCAEMTPHELRVLEEIRQLPQPDVDVILRLLRIPKLIDERRKSRPIIPGGRPR